MKGNIFLMHCMFFTAITTSSIYCAEEAEQNNPVPYDATESLMSYIDVFRDDLAFLQENITQLAQDQKEQITSLKESLSIIQESVNAKSQIQPLQDANIQEQLATINTSIRSLESTISTLQQPQLAPDINIEEQLVPIKASIGSLETSITALITNLAQSQPLQEIQNRLNSIQNLINNNAQVSQQKLIDLEQKIQEKQIIQSMPPVVSYTPPVQEAYTQDLALIETPTAPPVSPSVITPRKTSTRQTPQSYQTTSTSRTKKTRTVRR